MSRMISLRTTFICVLGLSTGVLSCGDIGEEISTVQPDIFVDVSGKVTFVGGTAVDGSVDEVEMDIWLGTLQDLLFKTSEDVTFKGSKGSIDNASSSCTEESSLGPACPFGMTTNIGMGITIMSRVEDPRGEAGNWVTTISPAIIPSALSELRADPKAVTSDNPVVFTRDLLALLGLVTGRDTQAVERSGIGFYLVQETGADGNIVPMAGVTLSASSRLEYQVIYGGPDGFPDPTLEATSTAGSVWIMPAAANDLPQLLFPTLTAADGRIVDNTNGAQAAFILPAAVVISGGFFQAE